MDHLVRSETFVREGFLNGELVVSIFFYSKKAYDTTWKCRIFKSKIYMIWTPGDVFPFFFYSNCLSERKFLVRVGASLSDLYNHEMRVPQYFLKIFKNILENWRVSPFWREATLIHIVKPGKKFNEPKNYRPIVLTSYVCKTMERMINDRVVWFLESFSQITKKDFLKNCQYQKFR